MIQSENSKPMTNPPLVNIKFFPEGDPIMSIGDKSVCLPREKMLRFLEQCVAELKP